MPSKKKIRAALACSLAPCALMAAGPSIASATPTVTASGSTSIYPLAVKLAKGYLGDRGHNIIFKIFQGGSDVGISDVAHGRVSIGDSSRDPKPSDPGGLQFTRIARDAVCIITNRSNSISDIDTSAIQAIFTGRVRRWSQVPGAHRRGSIDLVVRTAASGTQDAFQNIFLGQHLRVSGSASQKSSNGLVQQAVRNDKNAVGYVSFDFTGGVHPIPYQGVGCTLRNAKSGQYGGTRNFWMVTRGSPGGAAKTWINWIRGSGPQRNIVGTHWVPIR